METTQDYLMVSLKLLGALGLLIYGMRMMSDALLKMAGPQLRHILARMTTNRLTGMLTGTFVTCAVQSSSATTVMTVSFVSAGLLTLAQAISHELKTPVASILGYTDTILDNPQMDDQTRQQFIERTHAQAQRLTALLQDLSTLNRMDYATDVLSMERVDISVMMADIVEETALAVASKRMQLKNCLPQDVSIDGNWSLVYSIFRNLVDNAINYAGEGTTMELSAVDKGNCWAFTFKDNGVGIAEKHLPHIFERFYRVDKGRSRSMGGTGLGLAIVKNAVLLHGGQITVSNISSGGLQFDFTLKKN